MRARTVLTTLLGLTSALATLHRPHGSGSPEGAGPVAVRLPCDSSEPCHEPGHDHSGSGDAGTCLLCKISPQWAALPAIDQSAGFPAEAHSISPPESGVPTWREGLLPSPRGPPVLA